MIVWASLFYPAQAGNSEESEEAIDGVQVTVEVYATDHVDDCSGVVLYRVGAHLHCWLWFVTRVSEYSRPSWGLFCEEVEIHQQSCADAFAGGVFGVVSVLLPFP